MEKYQETRNIDRESTHVMIGQMAVGCVRKIKLLKPNQENDKMNCFFSINTEDKMTNGGEENRNQCRDVGENNHHD